MPTPVGNLGDMTFRAVEVLKGADLVLAEDTRTSSVLLKHYDIHVPLQSHHKFNEHQTVDIIKEKILAGANVALISDAGTPGISDPGFLLARTCAAEGITVETLPGATACIPALVSSGLPCDRFCFEGFLPQKKGRRTTLDQLSQFFGPERECSVAREISKVHEEHVRGTLEEVSVWFHAHEPKGEIVIVVAGKSNKKQRGREIEERDNELDI